jgi:cytochrome c-type biogenesis protein CcmF
VGPPAFTPFVVPLGIILVILSGIGPLISWRRATLANMRPQFIGPIAFAALILVLVLTLTDAGTKPLAVAMFTAGAFVVGTVVQEFHRGTAARRAMTGESWPGALAALVRRNRRRYGGYTAHFGFAVMLIGIAASSSFQHSRNAGLRPGGSVSDDGYVFHYVRPTATATPERVSFGAIINVTKNGSHVTTLRTMQSFYPALTNSAGVIGRFFDIGNADSTIGLDAGPLRDIWAVAGANLTPLTPLINEGNRKFAALYNSESRAIIRSDPHISAAAFNAKLNDALSELNFWNYRNAAVVGIVGQYLKHPYTVQFLLIVSPMVTWLWAGALIIFIGGFTSLLPPALFERRRSTATARSPAAVRELA